MNTGKKLFFVLGILLLLGGSGLIVAWIGFQEHFRLLTRSIQQTESIEEEKGEKTKREQLFEDHSVIETKAEAQAFVSDLQGRLTGLENDDLPEE